MKTKKGKGKAKAVEEDEEEETDATVKASAPRKAAVRGSNARPIKSRETIEDSEEEEADEEEVESKKTAPSPKEKPFIDLKKRAASGTVPKAPKTTTERRRVTVSPTTQRELSEVVPDPEPRQTETAQKTAEAPVAKRTRGGRETYDDYVAKHGTPDDHLNAKPCDACALRKAECVSPKPGARCHWCGHVRRGCSLPPPKPRLTRGGKKVVAAESTKKGTGELVADPIDGGDVDAEGEDEEVVEVKKEGAKKPKRKAEEAIEEPKKKKVRVEEDRGEGSSRQPEASPRKTRLTSAEAAEIGRQAFPDRYFGKTKRGWMTQTRLLSTRQRILALESDIAVLSAEAEMLYELAECIEEGIAKRMVEEEREDEKKAESDEE